MAGHRSGDYEVLVNGNQTGGTYADLSLAIDVACRLHKSNAPHTITVHSISLDETVWHGPPHV